MGEVAKSSSVTSDFRRRLKRRPPLVYAIVDIFPEGLGAAVDLAERLLRGGVDCLQLRGKSCPAGALEDCARRLLPEAAARGVPLLLNDRVDVAIAVGAHGVHVGQRDMPAEQARALLGPDPILGFSTHGLAQVEEAQSLPVDYLGFGSIFPTQSREASRIAGPQALTAAGAASTLPLIAIGGIAPERLAEIDLDSVAGVAAISAFLPLERTKDVLRRFRETLSGT